jgi:hypothetical protein
MFGKDNVPLRWIDNAMGAFFESSFELEKKNSDYAHFTRLGMHTRGIISAGSVTSLCASSSLKEMRCAISTSQ